MSFHLSSPSTAGIFPLILLFLPYYQSVALNICSCEREAREKSETRVVKWPRTVVFNFGYSSESSERLKKTYLMWPGSSLQRF